MRRLSDDAIRTLLRARLTKGDAFRLPFSQYDARQLDVRLRLSRMSRDELFKNYDTYLYDVKK